MNIDLTAHNEEVKDAGCLQQLLLDLVPLLVLGLQDAGYDYLGGVVHLTEKGGTR